MPTDTHQLDLTDPWTRFRYCTEPHKGHPGAVREAPSEEKELAAHEELATCVQGEELFGEE